MIWYWDTWVGYHATKIWVELTSSLDGIVHPYDKARHGSASHVTR
jgi:hypothetical protein